MSEPRKMSPSCYLIPHSWADRIARRDEKRRKLLAFLRVEFWTVPEIAGQIFGLLDMRAINSTLYAMQRDELIVREVTRLPSGRAVNIVGITMHGQAHIAHLLDRPMVDRAYEKGRVGLSLVDHRCDLQRLRIRLAQAGWKGWLYPDRQTVAQKTVGQTHRADAIVTHHSGRVVAVECERTVKTAKRYRVIAGHHLTAIASGDYERVIYTSPDIATVYAVRDLMLGISQAVVTGRVTPVTQEMRACFHFCTYADLVAQEIK